MKKVIQLIILIGILWYTHNNYEKFRQNSLFNVRNINIETKNQLLIDDLYKSVEDIEGKNILLINKKDMESKILGDVRVKDVTVEKIMPDTLNFNIKEKNPFAYIEYNGKIFISDEKGIIYGYMNESQKFNMPLFRVNSKEEIATFIQIIQKIPYSDEVSQIYTVPNGVAVTINNGLKIVTNINVDEQKYKVVEKLYNQVKSELNRRTRIEYIDLRFNDYIIKKGRG